MRQALVFGVTAASGRPFLIILADSVARVEQALSLLADRRRIERSATAA